MEKKRYKAICPFCQKELYVEKSISMELGFECGIGSCWNCNNMLRLRFLSEEDEIYASTWFKSCDFSKFKLPIAVVYKNPIDYPDKYVIRIHETLPKPKATEYYTVHNSYDECLIELKEAGFLTKIPKDKDDYQCIVESWIR